MRALRPTARAYNPYGTRRTGLPLATYMGRGRPAAQPFRVKGHVWAKDSVAPETEGSARDGAGASGKSGTMKITINVDCTPEEARAFLGLPDVAPMQETMMEEVRKRMTAALEASDPETLMKTWMPLGLQGLEQAQRMFWSQLAKTAGDAKKGGKTDDG